MSIDSSVLGQDHQTKDSDNVEEELKSKIVQDQTLRKRKYKFW